MSARSPPASSSSPVGAVPAQHGGSLSIARSSILSWWKGLQKAVCLHRCVVFFVHDNRILVKTGQCLGLNGVIFLGSILLWDYALSPLIGHLLRVSLPDHAAHVVLIQTLLHVFFGVVWLIPVYLVSFSLSCVWYQEIAELAFKVHQGRSAKEGGGAATRSSAPRNQDLMVQVAQELYRTVLFALFFLQTFAIGLLPWIGPPVKFVMLSWLNALYSFDYKWSLMKRSLQERMLHFETHWAFFAGFGSICTLATVALPFFSGAAVSAMVYPFFVLLACEIDPAAPSAGHVAGKGGQSELAGPRLPIFYVATRATSWVLNHGTELLRIPLFLWNHRLQLAIVALAGICLAAAPLLIELSSKLN